MPRFNKKKQKTICCYFLYSRFRGHVHTCVVFWLANEIGMFSAFSILHQAEGDFLRKCPFLRKTTFIEHSQRVCSQIWIGNLRSLKSIKCTNSSNRKELIWNPLKLCCWLLSLQKSDWIQFLFAAYF